MHQEDLIYRSACFLMQSLSSLIMFPDANQTLDAQYMLQSSLPIPCFEVGAPVSALLTLSLDWRHSPCLHQLPSSFDTDFDCNLYAAEQMARHGIISTYGVNHPSHFVRSPRGSSWHSLTLDLGHVYRVCLCHLTQP